MHIKVKQPQMKDLEYMFHLPLLCVTLRQIVNPKPESHHLEAPNLRRAALPILA